MAGERRTPNGWQRAVPLRKYTTIRIGGPAAYLTKARTVEELVRAVEQAYRQGIPYRVIGRGSNLVVSDAGFDGLIVVNQTDGLSVDPTADGAIVRAASGTALPKLARVTAGLGLTGLEWAVQVPGTVGGAVVNNAGAFGGATADVLDLVEVFHPEHGRTIWRTEELGLAYRDSRFRRGRADGWVILAATFRLVRSDPADAIARLRAAVEHRRRTQPFEPSAGSTFKNPGPDAPAGWLLDRAGLKGVGVGGVMFSPLHANFIINRGDGTAADVLALVDLGRREVRARFGVELELEIELFGAGFEARREVKLWAG
jgi:UDP-N-acetylmuramate dehydrogenase